MSKHPIVGVLLSTYNGEQYIKEQLDSIFGQRDVDVRLFVRDDGSSDSTLSIVEEYAKDYPIDIIVDGENVRPGESYMRLLYKHAHDSGIEFYAFADQDDIWLEDKLIVAVRALEKYTGPALYTSNQFLYVDGENRGNRHKEPQRIDLVPHMTKNTISGCTFVMNKHLAELAADVDRPDKRVIKHRLHDAWLMLVAIVCGEVIYDESSYMLYRIHDANTVGIREISMLTRIKKIKRLFVTTDDANIRMITAQELLRLYGDKINNHDKEILRLYADYKKNWKNKFKLAFSKYIRQNCAENPNMFTLKVLTNFV